MRYDTPVYIQRTSPGAYNASTGNYASDTVTEEKVYVNLQSAETESKSIDHGAVMEETITVTFQNPPKSPFTSIKYNGKIYKMTSSLYPRTCKTFVLKEDK